MPIIPGGGDRWKGRRDIEAEIVEALLFDFSDDDVRKALGKAFDFVVSEEARRQVVERKAVVVYEAMEAAIIAHAGDLDGVHVGGLGKFRVKAAGASGRGAVYPAGVGLGPLCDDFALATETITARVVCGDSDGVISGAWADYSAALGGLLWASGDFAQIVRSEYVSPNVNIPGGDWGEGWYMAKGQVVELTGSGAGPDRVWRVGGFWGVVHGVQKMSAAGVRSLEVIDGGAAGLHEIINNFHGFDYVAAQGSGFLAGVDEQLGVGGAAPPSSAYYDAALPGLSASQMMRGFPREVVRMAGAVQAGGFRNWVDVNWLNAAEFLAAFGAQRAQWESAGAVFPEMPTSRILKDRIVCSFDDEFKVAVAE